MITQKDFIKKFSMLSTEERQVLAKQTIEFKDKVIPVLKEMPTPWSKETIKAFDSGLMLISTLFNARMFCLSAYSYKDTSKRLNGLDVQLDILLNTLVSSGDVEKTSQEDNSGYLTTPPSSLMIGKSFKLKPPTGKAGRPSKPQNIPSVAVAGIRDSVLHPEGNRAPLRPTIADRPQHFADYCHLLPPDLQKEGKLISDMYTEMANIANKLDYLCADPEKTTQKDRAYYAVKLCNIEDKIRNLWNRIDVAYAEATGKNVSTDYKKYLEDEMKRINGEVKEKALAEMTKFEIDAMPEGETKELAKNARILRDKKFLRRDDRTTNDQHLQNLMDAAKELHDWGVTITKTQANNCARYGYIIPTEWIELPTEERKKLRQQVRNEERKKERAKAREEREALHTAAMTEVAAPYKGDDSMSLFSKDNEVR